MATKQNKNTNNKAKQNMPNSSAKNALHNFKMETAKELGVNLKPGYNGDLTSKQAGSIGGQMVKKLIKKAENSLK